MDIFIARQPIFDRQMAVYGYELLYRKDNRNAFFGLDDDTATAELIYNSVLVMGLGDLTDGTLAFINFSKALIASEIPYLLPAKNVVIEVLERNEATAATIEACEKLSAHGYTLALDDFILDENNSPLIDYAGIVKVEYPALSEDVQRKLIGQYGSRIRFLAEKIETREDYLKAADMGYDLFQGYFFSKPAMIGSKKIESLDTNIIRIINELNSTEPSYKAISEIIECDLGLSYKLLKLVNSVYYGTRNKISTISHALTYIGAKELYHWFSLMMLKDIQNIENAEMIRLSLVRGKLMELLAAELRHTRKQSEAFFVGMFSFIDVLLNKPMAQIVETLPFSDDVKLALLGENNEFRKLLACVISSESVDWKRADCQYLVDHIGLSRFMELYLESLKWAKKLNY